MYKFFYFFLWNHEDVLAQSFLYFIKKGGHEQIKENIAPQSVAILGYKIIVSSYLQTYHMLSMDPMNLISFLQSSIPLYFATI